MLGIASILFLPDRPESTTFLNERERKLALERMNRSTSGDQGAVIQKGNTERSQNYLHIDFSFQTMFMPLSVIGGCVCCLFFSESWCSYMTFVSSRFIWEEWSISDSTTLYLQFQRSYPLSSPHLGSVRLCLKTLTPRSKNIFFYQRMLELSCWLYHHML